MGRPQEPHPQHRGRVRLCSIDPRDIPLVDFHCFTYFTEGTDKDGPDLEAMADAVEFVRGTNRKTGSVILGDAARA
ncbi:hypothetical protein [Streptomyces sp. TE5632]